ncbi:MAG: DUF2334 domain-containing protein [Lachnospiraceae bacterium]|nr:DUF2334 domain-containing protein [Lachnospiraceae bacterium]
MIAVRIDDMTPDMDWDSFHRFKELLDTYGIKPLIGVVPDNQDSNLQRGRFRDDFWDCMRQLQQEGWSIALHGYHHVYTTGKGGLFPLNHFSEFAGVDYEQQLDMITYGKRTLQSHGIETDIFMAPGHSYDRNTLRALQKAGFRYVTDGFGDRPYHWEQYELTFLPIAFQSGKDIEKKESYTTLVYHINQMTDAQLERHRRLMERHRDEFITFQEYQQITPAKSTIWTRAREEFLARCKFLLVRMLMFKKQQSNEN